MSVTALLIPLRRYPLVGTLCVLLCACVAKASSNVFEFRPEGSVPVSLAYQSEEAPVAEEIPPEFGDAGSVRVQVGASGAYDFDDVTMALARTSVSLFIFKGLSLDLEADTFSFFTLFTFFIFQKSQH